MKKKRENARYTFAKNVKILRIKKNLSQEKLAYLSSLHRTYIGAIERGERNISIDNMERIANALDTELTNLLTYETI